MKILIGISACLTGEAVRYDKSHKRSNFCMNELSKHVEFKPVCPEVAIGMNVPRPTIRQVKQGKEIRVTQSNGTGDVTDKLRQFGENVAANSSHLSGFIFTAKSPSCGMERVKVYHQDEEGNIIGSESTGVGLFAAEIMKHNPALPCEENGRLNDPIIKENFILRVFAYHHWLSITKNDMSKHKLIQFHSQYKYLLLSHSQRTYRELGRLLATSKQDLVELCQTYIVQFMTALKQKATRRSHCNTLQHIQGYFSKYLDKQQKMELTQQIHDYREGLTPLVAPLTLIKHYLMLHPNQYLARQRYLEPYPAELRLRYGY